MVRGDVVDSLAEFGAVLCIFEDFGPNIREPKELRVERSSRRTPSWSSRSATRRLTVEVGILRRRAASEKLFASTTLAKITSELRSVIVFRS